MSDGVLAAVITSIGALLLAVWNTVDRIIQRRQEKKTGRQEQLDRMEQKIDAQGKRLEKAEQHNDLQYLSLLRLTVMDSDMPMSERLVAGKDYLHRGGNGDVKKYYEELERKVNGHAGDAL